jgi:hypothetical protein
MVDKKDEAVVEKPAAKEKAGPKIVFRINVDYRGKHYAEGSEVPADLLKDDYIKQYVVAKQG